MKSRRSADPKIDFDRLLKGITKKQRKLTATRFASEVGPRDEQFVNLSLWDYAEENRPLVRDICKTIHSLSQALERRARGLQADFENQRRVSVSRATDIAANMHNELAAIEFLMDFLLHTE